MNIRSHVGNYYTVDGVDGRFEWTPKNGFVKIHHVVNGKRNYVGDAPMGFKVGNPKVKNQIEGAIARYIENGFSISNKK